MKRITSISMATVLGAAVALAPAALAQNPPAGGPESHPPMHARGDRHQRAMEKLNLTDQQKQQMAEMRKEHRAKLEALRNDTSITPEQKREQMRAYREQFQQEMQSILTPEQKKQMQEWKQKAKGMHGGKRGRRGGPDQAPPPGND
jgi:protein CpxP